MGLEQVGDLVRAVDDEDALAVVAAPRRLQHDGPADVVGEGGGLVDGAHLRPGRLRLAGIGERAAQDQLVLGVHQGRRPRRDPVARALQGVQVLGRHVLVVEGDDRGAVGQALEGSEVAVVTDLHVGGHEPRRLARFGHQHPQRLAEGDGRLMRHARELSTADHGHDRQPGARIEGSNHGGARVAARPSATSRATTVEAMQWAEMVRVRTGTTWRLLVKELSAFGIVGAACFVIDVVLFQLLYAHVGIGAVTAKFLATVVSMTVAYFAHRYWSFSHRARTGVRREYLLFALVNAATLLITVGAVALVRYPLGQDSAFVLQLANVASIAVGTVVRYLAYRKWVFPAVPSRRPSIPPPSRLHRWQDDARRPNRAPEGLGDRLSITFDTAFPRRHERPATRTGPRYCALQPPDRRPACAQRGPASLGYLTVAARRKSCTPSDPSVPAGLREARSSTASIWVPISDSTQGAGGNLSLKTDGVLWIKASGTRLSQAARSRDLPADGRDGNPRGGPGRPRTLTPVRAAGGTVSAGLRPSIETALHVLLPHTGWSCTSMASAPSLRASTDTG